MHRSCRTSRPARAFTLVELLVSMAVLSLMLVMLITLMSQTGKIWRSTNTKIEAFQDARVAFESMTRNISQATLNTYYEYYDSKGQTPSDVTTGVFTPASYGRFSELHYISAPSDSLMKPLSLNTTTGTYVSTPVGHAIFFHALLGYIDPQTGATPQAGTKQLISQLNALGYYLEFANDKRSLPPMVKTTSGAQSDNANYRYRLTEFMQPTEALQVYAEKWANRTPYGLATWFDTPIRDTNGSKSTHVMAQNIVALVIRPKRADAEEAALQAAASSGGPVTPLCKDYKYDTRPYKAKNDITDATAKLQTHQLPPLVGVTMIAIDESSAARLAARYQDKPPMDQLSVDNGPALSTLFKETASTNDSTGTPNYNSDLKLFISGLVKAKVNYRVFDTEIIIRGSKWTEK